MTETKQHYGFKKSISEHMSKSGWNVFTEFRITLESEDFHWSGIGPKKHIIVDVFAVKNGKEYICEIGSLSEECRLGFLKAYFDKVDHMSLDWKSCRSSSGRKLKKADKMKYSYRTDDGRVRREKPVTYTEYGFL